MSARHLSRRQFAKALAGIVVSFTLAPRVGHAAEAKLPGDLGAAPMLDAWIRIEANGNVTIFTGKVELGQGVLTALAQIAAEELDVAFARISMVAGDTALTPNESYTSGSQSIEYSGTALRFASAEARALLLQKAAGMLGTPVEQLKVANGIVHAPHGRKLGYGKIAEAGLLHRAATAAVPPKPAAAHRIVGKSAARLDIPHKVFGQAIYVQDMRLPGMVFGRVVRPPGPGARLDVVDIGPAQAVPGVLAVVRYGSFLGVVAAREEQAVAAREILRKNAKWRTGPELPAPARIAEWLQAEPSEDEVVAEKASAGAAPALKQLEEIGRASCRVRVYI